MLQFLLLISGILSLLKVCHKDDVKLSELTYVTPQGLAQSTCSINRAMMAVSEEQVGIQAALVSSCPQMGRAKAKPHVLRWEWSSWKFPRATSILDRGKAWGTVLFKMKLPHSQEAQAFTEGFC